MQQSKPIIEWLQTIADPTVRELAIANCQCPNEVVNSLYGAIACAFSWDATQQKGEYWDNIYDTIKEHGNYPAPAPSEEGEVWDEALQSSGMKNLYDLFETCKGIDALDNAMNYLKQHFNITRKTSI